MIDIGVVPTPVLYFAAHHLERRGGGDDHRQPQPARGQRLQDHASAPRRCTAPAIAALRDRGRRSCSTEPAPHPQSAMQSRDVDRPPTSITRPAQLQLGARRCKVVVDAGNGAGGPTAVVAVSPARLRRRPAVLRARRPVPEPPPRSDAARERRRPDRDGRRGRRRARHRARRRRRSHRRGRRARAGSCGATS